MEKIAYRGIKIDLHIHSEFSKSKDGKKVAENTLENLPVLIQQLVNNEVEMCAITDHDNFNFNMYSKLKSEEKNSNCIKKVLPGIEFSVEFIENKIIHIVTIFDDGDSDKVKKIEEIMNNGKGKESYNNKKQAYSKKDYFVILSEIDIDFVMIAHQKNTPSSQGKPRKNDVLSLGQDVFNQLVFMDYFDAYEFRSKKNEIYNKVYKFQNCVEDNLRFITGSDCHTWTLYPYTEAKEKKEFKFTYIKSLPTFKGLAMAITDSHRIELENSFYNPNEKYIKEIVIEINGKDNRIPLSKGINVIIGDNSVGKSLFLNSITGNCKKIDKRLYLGYEKYIEKHKLVFKTVIDEDDIFRFNQQGEIRSIFDADGLKPDKYLCNFYPTTINASKYKTIVEQEFEKLYEALQIKFSYDEDLKKLPKFIIPKYDDEEKPLSFLDNLEKIKTDDLQKLIDLFDKTIDSMNGLINNALLEEDDRKHVLTSLEMMKIMKEKYDRYLGQIKLENDKINILKTFIGEFRNKYNRMITDQQSIFSEFVMQKKIAIDTMADLCIVNKSLKTYQPNILTTDIIPETNPVDKYIFVSKLQIERIDNDYIDSIITSVISRGKKIDTKVITQSELKDMIKNYPNEDETMPLDVFKRKVNAKLERDFKVRNTIVEENMEVSEEVSAGFDAQMYFTLLSGEMRDRGLYIIDQPEDHISQKAIKEKVLDQFRRMGHQRQVIMVTHNPQFIVNLDVDNVIYLSKREGEFLIQSGALEYEDDEYSILKLVADNIEGGLQTIQGRMKRYEKDI